MQYFKPELQARVRVSILLFATKTTHVARRRLECWVKAYASVRFGVTCAKHCTALSNHPEDYLRRTNKHRYFFKFVFVFPSRYLFATKTTHVARSPLECWVKAYACVRFGVTCAKHCAALSNHPGDYLRRTNKHRYFKFVFVLSVRSFLL